MLYVPKGVKVEAPLFSNVCSEDVSPYHAGLNAAHCGSGSFIDGGVSLTLNFKLAGVAVPETLRGCPTRYSETVPFTLTGEELDLSSSVAEYPLDVTFLR